MQQGDTFTGYVCMGTVLLLVLLVLYMLISSIVGGRRSPDEQLPSSPLSFLRWRRRKKDPPGFPVQPPKK